ncbi:MAG: hypothetical protein AAGI08_05815 [Bacteroidota bacterium]
MKRPHLLVLVLLGLLPAWSTAQVSVLSSLAQDYDVVPGIQYSGEIEVHNDGTAVREVRVYQTDYDFQSDGRNVFGDPGSMTRSNAPWIQFSTDRLRIPPGTSQMLQYTVEIPAELPDGGGPNGSYWSILMLEPIPESDPLALGNDPEQVEFGVRQVIRYAVQVATHVQGTGTRNVEFAGVDARSSESGQLMFDVNVANTGEQMIRPTVWAEFYDPNGTLQKRIDGSLLRMYPGTSVRHSMPLDSLAAGSYQALVVVDAGGNDVFGTQVAFDIE